MGFFGRLLGIEDDASRPAARAPAPPPDSDAQAIERYRYMVRTAPPETLEQAYAEAFAKLTPEQREKVRSELSLAAPEAERAAIASDPQALARAATRAEIREPGSTERSLGAGALGGAGMGFGANLLSSFAMGFVGSMVAQSFFSALGGSGAAGGDAGAVADNGDLGEDVDAGDFGDGGDDFDV